jgi:hypothetical protein
MSISDIRAFTEKQAYDELVKYGLAMKYPKCRCGDVMVWREYQMAKSAYFQCQKKECRIFRPPVTKYVRWKEVFKLNTWRCASWGVMFKLNMRSFKLNTLGVHTHLLCTFKVVVAKEQGKCAAACAGMLQFFWHYTATLNAPLNVEVRRRTGNV